MRVFQGNKQKVSMKPSSEIPDTKPLQTLGHDILFRIVEAIDHKCSGEDVDVKVHDTTDDTIGDYRI